MSNDHGNHTLYNEYGIMNNDHGNPDTLNRYRLQCTCTAARFIRFCSTVCTATLRRSRVNTSVAGYYGSSTVLVPCSVGSS